MVALDAKRFNAHVVPVRHADFKTDPFRVTTCSGSKSVNELRLAIIEHNPPPQNIIFTQVSLNQVQDVTLAPLKVKRRLHFHVPLTALPNILMP
jgi:hypothetical protein